MFEYGNILSDDESRTMREFEAAYGDEIDWRMWRRIYPEYIKQGRPPMDQFVEWASRDDYLRNIAGECLDDIIRDLRKRQTWLAAI